ncbi:MAG: glycosyltransferase family 4 protein [Methanoregulaceae archaeon]|jgi:glycosyltransferase involved in cell wall biosynthesis
MKILIVQDTDWKRRNPYQQVHIAERMALRGHEIRVIDYEILWQTEGKKELFSRRTEEKISRIFPEAQIPVIRPGILKITVLDYVSMLFTYPREINKQIREFKPDIMMGNDILTTWLAFRAAKRYNIPTLFYSIDVDYRLIPQKFLQSLGKRIESWNIRNADLVLSINEGLREYTIRMGASREKTEVIRAGIDLERYDPSKINGDKVRAQYGIATDDIVLFFMGWLYHFSGLIEVAQELAKIEDKELKIKLFIVGQGDAFDHLIQVKEHLNLDNQMIMAGQQPFEKIPSFIAAADICLLPAHDNEIMHDIVPIKMYEYLAMGKPVVATKLYGVMTEFGEGNGITYADSPEMVLEKAIEIIEKGDVELEGEKARSFVKMQDWNILTDLFQQALRRVMLSE